MSIDVLQDKIRKKKNPSMVSLELPALQLPPHILAQTQSKAEAYGVFCCALLEGLKDVLPAVRIPWGMFTLQGAVGCEQLSRVLKTAADLGYYVLLDGLDISGPVAAQIATEELEGGAWLCDAIVVPAYLGSDCIKPFLTWCKDQKKDIFVRAKTSNKSAPALQDLHTGSRQVHTAAMDLVNRYGEPLCGKFGYSSVAAVVGATAPDTIRTLRSKYQKTFFLTDGYDYPNGNAKNCSMAFDRMGHGAVACAGMSVTAAWVDAGTDGSDYVQQAAEAVLRMKKNLTRYVTVL